MVVVVKSRLVIGLLAKQLGVSEILERRTEMTVVGRCPMFWYKKSYAVIEESVREQNGYDTPAVPLPPLSLIIRIYAKHIQQQGPSTSNYCRG